MKPQYTRLLVGLLLVGSLLTHISRAQRMPDTLTTGKEAKNAFYHPDSPTLFRSLTEYQSWYSQPGNTPSRHVFNPDSLTVGFCLSILTTSVGTLPTWIQ